MTTMMTLTRTLALVNLDQGNLFKDIDIKTVRRKGFKVLFTFRYTNQMGNGGLQSLSNLGICIKKQNSLILKVKKWIQRSDSNQ